MGAVGRRGLPGPWGSSFPSGHAASDVGFTLGVSQELPGLLLPLSLATAGAHWSLINARDRSLRGVIAGGMVAIATTAAAWQLRPPQRQAALLRARADLLHPAGRSDRLKLCPATAATPCRQSRDRPARARPRAQTHPRRRARPRGHADQHHPWTTSGTPASRSPTATYATSPPKQ